MSAQWSKGTFEGLVEKLDQLDQGEARRLTDNMLSVRTGGDLPGVELRLTRIRGEYHLVAEVMSAPLTVEAAEQLIRAAVDPGGPLV